MNSFFDKILPLAFTLGLLLTACEGTYIDAPVINQKQSAVVNGLALSGEPTLLMISKSMPINHPKGYDAMIAKEATIKYYVNGILKETQKISRDQNKMTLTPSDLHKLGLEAYVPRLSDADLFFKSTIIPKPNDQIRLEIEIPECEVACIEAKMPEAPMANIKSTEIVSLDEAENPFKYDLIAKSYRKEFLKATNLQYEAVMPNGYDFGDIIDEQKLLKVEVAVEKGGSDYEPLIGAWIDLDRTLPSITLNQYEKELKDYLADRMQSQVGCFFAFSEQTLTTHGNDITINVLNKRNAYPKGQKDITIKSIYFLPKVICPSRGNILLTLYLPILKHPSIRTVESLYRQLSIYHPEALYRSYCSDGYSVIDSDIFDLDTANEASKPLGNVRGGYGKVLIAGVSSFAI